MQFLTILGSTGSIGVSTLDVVARKYALVKKEHGSNALAVLASAKCTNEENYLFNKFTRQVVGTNTIDHCARL